MYNIITSGFQLSSVPDFLQADDLSIILTDNFQYIIL